MALLLLMACGRVDEDAWWNTTWDTGGALLDSGEDDTGDWDDEDEVPHWWGELEFEDGTHGVLVYEEPGCELVHELEDIEESSCSDCEKAWSFSVGALEESEGDCSAPDGMTESLGGAGYLGEQAWLKLDGSWTEGGWAEVEDSAFFFFEIEAEEAEEEED